MKLILCTKDTVYGVGTNISQLLSKLDSNKEIEKVAVICFEPLSGFSKKVIFYKIPKRGQYFITNSIWFGIDCNRKINQLTKSENFDLVHTHAPILGFGIEIPIIVSMHVIQASYLSIKSKGDLKLLISNFFHYLYSFLDRYIVNRSSRVVLVSNYSFTVAKELYPKLVYKFVLDRITIDIDRFMPVSNTEKRKIRVKYGINSRKRIFLFVGRLDPMKGINELLCGYKQFREKSSSADSALVLVGDATNFKIAREYKDSVKLLGRIERKQIHEIYQMSDIFIFPSYYETYGLSAIEAMSTGLVTISTKVGDIGEFIVDKHMIMGRLSCEQIAQKMIYAVGLSNEQIRLVSKTNRNEVVKFATKEKKSSCKILNLYKDVISQN